MNAMPKALQDIMVAITQGEMDTVKAQSAAFEMSNEVFKDMELAHKAFVCRVINPFHLLCLEGKLAEIMGEEGINTEVSEFYKDLAQAMMEVKAKHFPE